MHRRGKVYFRDTLAGVLEESEEGYTFSYNGDYLNSETPLPVSLTLPLTRDKYVSRELFPFFDGLIPEGWLLDIATINWKLNPNDRMGLLLEFCEDTIGAVTIVPEKEAGDDI